MANTDTGFVSELTPCVRHAAVIGMALAFLCTLAFTPGAQAASTIAIAETLAAATGQDIGAASDVVERLMTASAAATSWALLARHGECFADMETVLRHRFDNLPPIASPDDFVAALRARRIETRVSRMPELGDDAVTVEVPSQEVSLVFVRHKLCTSFLEHHE